MTRTRTTLVVGLALAGLTAAGLTAADPAVAVTLAPVRPMPAQALASGTAGTYVAVLKPGTAPAATRVAASVALARAAGGTVLASYTAALAGYAVQVPSAAVLDAVRADPAVEFLEPDQAAYPNFDTDLAAAVPAGSWALDRLDQPLPVLDGAPYAPARTGAGTTVFVVDTGVVPTSTELGDGTVAGSRVAAGWSFTGGDGRRDCSGHGTAVAAGAGGATVGVATAVRIVPVDVSWKASCSAPPQPRPDVDLHRLLAGIDWVTTHHGPSSVALLASSVVGSVALDRAVSRSTTSGVVYVSAAGDVRGSLTSKDPCLRSPSGALANLVVGATTTNGTADLPASFSPVGSCIDLWAPGDAVVAPMVTANAPRAKVWGTAMAAAYVAGVVAVHLQARGPADPARVVWELRLRSPLVPLDPMTDGLVANAQDRLTGVVPADPCLAPDTTLTGSLLSGASATRPAGGYVVARDGVVHGCLAGPASADFDLDLQRWDPASGTWRTCDQDWGVTSTAMVTCAVAVGDKVRYLVAAYAGAGSYRPRGQLP